MKAEAATISAQNYRVLPRLPHSAMCLICVFIRESEYAVHTVTELPDATLRLHQAPWEGSRHIPIFGTEESNQCGRWQWNFYGVMKVRIDADSWREPHTPDLTETGPIEYRQGCPLLYRPTLNPRRYGRGQRERDKKGRDETDAHLL